MGGSEEIGGGGRYVKYSSEQLRILEKEYNDCPKPSAAKRASLVKDYAELGGIDVKSIKVWFQNRRCREKQRKESSRLVGVNAKLTALNKLLLEENDRLTKQALQLSSENRFLKLRLDSVNQALPKLENAAPAPNLSLVLANPNEDALPEQIRKLTDAALEQSASLSLPTEDSAGTTVNGEGDAAAKGSLLSLGLAHATPTTIYGHAHTQRALPTTPGLPQAAQDACQEFLAKATGNAVEWLQLPLLKSSGAESLGITSIAQGPRGVAARVCGLVALPAPKAAELLKDKAAWLRGCRRCEVLGGVSGAGGRLDLLYTQMYAPTTLAPPRDFCTLRYTTMLDDGAIVICERSLSSAEASVPAAPAFVRGEVFAGGFLLRPCDGGGCILIAVDHLDLEPWSVLDVLKPLYSSSAVLAHQTTLSSLRFLKRVAMEEGPDTDTGTTHQPAAWRVITERLARGFNEAVNAFADEAWVSLPSDGMDDVSVMARGHSDKDGNGNGGGSGGGVLCARASMLLQIVPPSTLVRFMHDHRAEWADPDIDASTAAAIQGAMRRQRPHGDKGRLPSDGPLAVAMDDQEFLELVKLEGRNSYSKDGETFLLQLCTCPDVNSAAAAQLVFAPVDAAAAGADVPLLPSGFRVIPVDTDELKADGLRGGRSGQNSLDAHAIDPAGTGDEAAQCWKSVLSIAFQFAYEAHSEEAVAAVARQYVRSVVASVQRVAMALAPTCIKMLAPAPRSPPASPDAVLLATRVVASYALHTGAELTDAKDRSPEGIFKAFWLHPSAILCWVVKASPEYTFANKAGLDILGTSIAELSGVEWNKSMDEDGRKVLYAASSQVLQQGYAHLPPGVTLSCQGHSAGYEKACMWKVVDERGNMMCVAIMYDNWTALHFH